MTDRLALIAGSRAYDLVREGKLTTGQLAPRQTPYGPSSPMGTVQLAGEEVVFLSRHGATGYELAAPFVNYRANIYALKDAGVTRTIAWSGPGAVDPELELGQFAVPDDLLDETRRRPSTFFEGTGLGFIRSYPLFCPQLAGALEAAARASGRAVRGGLTYVCTEGPRLETAAEIRMYASCGAHLVGMTLAPEVFLARELEMCYGALCYVSNYAEGVREAGYQPGELFEGMISQAERWHIDETLALFPKVIAGALKHLRETPRTCHCHETMKRYKLRGDIGDDWKQWLSKPS